MTPEEIEAMQQQNKDLADQLKTAEAGKGGDDESRKRLVYLEGEHKKLIEARDKSKTDLRLAEEKKLSEQGEFKILADNKQKELDVLTKQLEGLNGTITGYVERDKEELATLLESVPENLRGTVSSESIPLAEQLKLARELSTVKPQGPNARPGGEGQGKTTMTRANFDAKSALERSAFIKEGGTVTE